MKEGLSIFEETSTPTRTARLSKIVDKFIQDVYQIDFATGGFDSSK